MEILIIIGLILLNGFFAMSEIAVVSARKSKLENEVKAGSKSAAAALKLMEDPNKFLSTVQIGITLIGILTGIYSGATLANQFAIVLNNIGLPIQYSHITAQTLIIVGVTYLSIVFGELIPKVIGMTIATKVAKAIARPMHILSLIATPFVWLLSKSTSVISAMLGLRNSENNVTEEEIKSLIHEGTTTGEVKFVEQDIVGRVFSLGDRDVDSIMTPKHELIWIDVNLSNKEIIELLREKPHITYPIADKDLDHIIGTISLKDVFDKLYSDSFDIRNAIREALFLHEGMEVYDALEYMKTNHNQYGIVCDEFGSTQGIVTYHDILEGLIGEIPDKNEEASIIQRPDGSWLIDGQCEFYHFLQHFDIEYLAATNKYNTISGLILEHLGHIPKTGEILKWNIFTIEVIDMDGARIDKLLVAKRDLS